jgi:hypothetical protein
MRDRIAEAAKANARSMNSEIVARLEASFNAPPSGADAWAEVARLEAEHNACYVMLRGCNEELDREVKELEEADRAEKPDSVLASIRERIAIYNSTKTRLLEEWLRVGDLLKTAKLRAAGVSPMGSAFDAVSRRIFGEEQFSEMERIAIEIEARRRAK